VKPGWKRRSVDAVAAFLLRHPFLERGAIALGHARPGGRAVQALLLALSRQAAERSDRFRVVELRGGGRLLIDISDILRDLYLYGRDYEVDSTELVVRLLRPGDEVVDVGAHCGYYSVLMAGLVGAGGRVHAFEPNPALLELLARSAVLNGFEQRIVRNACACAAEVGRGVPLYVSRQRQNQGLSSLRPHPTLLAEGLLSADATQPVDTIRLDDYWARHGIESCALVKIDVECAEAAVLAGLCGVLGSRPPKTILCETSPGSDADRMLRGLGFQAYRVGAAAVPEQPWFNILYAAERDWLSARLAAAWGGLTPC
jgi:FkbM family methyltransferase